jgi:phage tail-like protein
VAVNRGDPYLAFRFSVCVGEKEDPFGGFSEVSGLSWEMQVETFREGGENLYERQLLGPNKYPSRVTLKRGLTDQESLWNWYQDVLKGKIRRESLTIKLKDSVGEAKRTWKFRNACPVKFTGPEFRAESAAVAFESVELVHDGLLSI